MLLGGSEVGVKEVPSLGEGQFVHPVHFNVHNRVAFLKGPRLHYGLHVVATKEIPVLQGRGIQCLPQIVPCRGGVDVILEVLIDALYKYLIDYDSKRIRSIPLTSFEKKIQNCPSFKKISTLEMQLKLKEISIR